MLPLDSNCNIRKDVLPFNVLLKPYHPERIEPEAMKVNKLELERIQQMGFDPVHAIDLFEKWFEKLDMKCNKYGKRHRIIPLGHHYDGFDKQFIRKWLGQETYDHYFHYHSRDTMHVAAYLSDKAGYHVEKIPYPRISLSTVAKRLGIPNDEAHTALGDCKMTAAVYQKFISMGLF
jgi:DNA polymerase III epsilon subunit-like protein